LKQDQNKYILPDEIINVRELGRRTVGSRTEGGQGGTLFEPFNLAYTNTYMLRAGATGGLATYYAFASYQELVGKMFGSFIQFHYDNATKTLTITQRPRDRHRNSDHAHRQLSTRHHSVQRHLF
jgi:hypothetical protein